MHKPQSSPSTPTRANLYGLADISILCKRMVKSLFPLDSSVFPDDLAEFVAYVLYRTALPTPIIFHSLHLLYRLSATHVPTPHSSSSHPDRAFARHFHHRLFVTSLSLATSYLMDNAYSSDSWSLASRGLFSAEEITQNSLGMFKELGWSLAVQGMEASKMIEVCQAALERVTQQREEREKAAETMVVDSPTSLQSTSDPKERERQVLKRKLNEDEATSISSPPSTPRPPLALESEPRLASAVLTSAPMSRSCPALVHLVPARKSWGSNLKMADRVLSRRCVVSTLAMTPIRSTA